MGGNDGFDPGRQTSDQELSRLAETLVSALRQIRELEREMAGDIPPDERTRLYTVLSDVVAQSWEVEKRLGAAMDQAGTIGVLTSDSLVVRQDDPDVLVSGPEEVTKVRNEDSPEFIVFPRSKLGL